MVTAAPATIGLHRVANRMANYRRVDSGFFWEAARSNIGRGWLLYIIAMLMPLAVIFNIWFYIQSEATFMRVIGVAWVWIMLLVLMLSQYIFPLFWQQDEPSIKLVLRNAFLLALRYPLYTLLLLIFQILIIGVSVAITLPAVLLMPALVAIAANFGLAGVLQEMGMAPEPPEIPRH